MAEFDCEETKRHVHEYLHNELSDQELTRHHGLTWQTAIVARVTTTSRTRA